MPPPILIAGAGPVGLTLAIELARFGAPVRIVDQAAARSDKSKALAVWPRTLELLERAGCAEAFAATGLKSHGVAIRAGDDLIARVGFDGIASPYPYLLLLPQSETERLLDAKLASLGVAVERCTELTAFADAGTHAMATLRHADGRSESLDAAWLVGCDGAHSLVRHALGLAFEGDTLPTNFVLADVHVAGLSGPTDELSICWHQDGIVVFFPIAPGRYRIIADTGAQALHAPTLEQVADLVGRRCPDQVTVSDPVWLSGFAINERKVPHYRVGRVFVAGDAAHVHSPAGGQGMNTGMHDAMNLGWKLALVAAGRADPALLDTYSAERSPVAAQVLQDSGHLTRVATLRNHAAQALRNFVAHRLLGLHAVQDALVSRLAEIAVEYAHSPLNAGSAEGLRGPAPGQRVLAERPFGAGPTPRFALLAADADDVRAVLRTYAALLEPDLRTPPDPQGVWLVRPDGYVAAVTRSGDARVIGTWLHALAGSASG